MFSESQTSDVMGAGAGWSRGGEKLVHLGLTCDIAVALPNSIAASNPAMWIFDKIKEVYKASAAGATFGGTEEPEHHPCACHARRQTSGAFPRPGTAIVGQAKSHRGGARVIPASFPSAPSVVCAELKPKRKSSSP